MSVIIPLWNGLELLRKNLPSVLAASVRVDEGCEILIVDDASTDGGADFVRERFPAVRVLRRDVNGGFGPAVRTGVDAAEGPILYFLNTDVELEEDALSSIVAHFSRPDVFAVASIDVGRPACLMPAFNRRLGLLGVQYLATPTPAAPCPILFATGGHAAYDAAKFRELGGFDTLFDPFYWEDIDLCVRARARSWAILMEPNSRVRHSGAGTVARRHRPARIEAWRAGHRLLFSLRHGRTPPAAALALAASHGWASLPALGSAALQWPMIEPQTYKSRGVLREFSSAAVKRTHGVPRTVAFFSPFGHVAGGGEASLIELVASLDRAAFRPIVSCPNEGDLARRLRELGVAVALHPLPSTAAGLIDGTVPRLARWLADEGCDVVHANASGRTLALPAVAAKTLGLPVVWHARIAERDWLMDRLGVALCDRVIATSSFVASKFSSTDAPKAVAVIPNAVDARRFAPPADRLRLREQLGFPASAILLGTVGRMHRWKRFDLAVEAFARARARAARLRLVLIGDGPAKGELKALAARLGVSEAMEFLGWREDPAETLSAMDAVIHPTPGEHFGRVFIEAMACGVPVVARAGGGASEILEDGVTGRLVRGDDPAAYAACILDLLGTPGLRDRMGAAGRAEALRRYEPAAVARRIEAVYDELLDV